MNYKLRIKMQSTSAFLDIAKFSDFREKNTDVSRTLGVHQIIRTFFNLL